LLVRRLASCGIAASVLAYTTARQDRSCAAVIASTTLVYGIAYGLLKFTGSLQPAKGVLNVADVPEWRSRILATVNAVALTVGSVACFAEWPYEPKELGWTGRASLVGNVDGGIYSSYPETFAALFVGYLQWDVLWLLWHAVETDDRQRLDVSSILHHVLFLSITHYVLSGSYFHLPFAWLALTELSTPFLNARWCLAAAGRKADNAYFWVTIGFVLTFTATRVVGYTLGIVNMWQNVDIWRSLPETAIIAAGLSGLDLVVVGVHCGYILNMFWFSKVVVGLQRMIRRSGRDVSSPPGAQKKVE